ncbi:hypothetical protein RclHR1_01350022 [Rhizophagus clarus]|nr:hypothetical protein RclHR1_01350022 [Rhizophagus clarus]
MDFLDVCVHKKSPDNVSCTTLPERRGTRVLYTLRKDNSLESAIIEGYKSIEITASDIYRTDIIRLGKHSEKLRSWLKEAQQSSGDITSRLTKKDAKERIILQKNEKIERLTRIKEAQSKFRKNAEC